MVENCWLGGEVFWGFGRHRRCRFFWFLGLGAKMAEPFSPFNFTKKTVLNRIKKKLDFFINSYIMVLTVLQNFNF